jgi:hypothetical protein
VHYDASRDDGLVVGQNAEGLALASPGGSKNVRWYAGDLRQVRVAGGNPNQRRFQIVATPVEFGGTNLPVGGPGEAAAEGAVRRAGHRARRGGLSG